jgi:D-psicose/D-tagatose/L-ribulose 3-epimerase
MQLSLCNEVLRPADLPAQCALAAELGYAGLEIAPFTLADDPTRLTDAQIAGSRRVVEDHGLVVTSLHWLLVAPTGLDLTATDSRTAARTRDALMAILDLAAGLGAPVVVHGSPGQRRLDPADPASGRRMALDHLSVVGRRAGELGIAYCLEAISHDECNWINTMAKAQALIEAAGEPALKLMLDVCHAAREETDSLPALIARYLPAGRLAHVQLNAANRRGPGQGDDPAGRDAIPPVLAALARHGYDGTLAIEPFDYRPDGPGVAIWSAAYVRGCLDQLAAATAS